MNCVEYRRTLLGIYERVIVKYGINGVLSKIFNIAHTISVDRLDDTQLETLLCQLGEEHGFLISEFL
jgi:hypothetical protein